MANRNHKLAYTQGTFAPGKPSKKICPNCGRRIDYNAKSCVCGATEAFGWKVDDCKDNYDLHISIISMGGLFARGEIVEIFAKNGRLALKDSKNNRKFFVLEKDFFLCSKRKSSFGDEVSLMFTEEIVNMKDDGAAEKLIAYIYSSISNRVYETEKAFFNATHELFPL